MDQYVNGKQKPTGGLRLAGGVSNNAGALVNATQPWLRNREMERAEEAVYVAPEISGELLDAAQTRTLKISKAVTHVISILFILVFGYSSIQDIAEFHQYLLPALGVFLACGAVYTVDAVLVNRMYKKNVSLYVLSWVFNFLYPTVRTKYIKRRYSIIAIGLAVLMIGTTVNFGCTYLAYSKSFSATYIAKDKDEQQMIQYLLEQPSENNKRLGELLGDAFQATGVAAKRVANQDVIVLIGQGLYDVDGNAVLNKKGGKSSKVDKKKSIFVRQDKCSVETQLVFIKNPKNDQYTLSSVKINEQQLLSAYVGAYWKMVVAE